ncbi:MAG TPA: cytochrome P450 [Thermoanaerobaculia bacterium]
MQRAPGPGFGVIPALSRLRREPLQVIAELHREYGDVVRLGTGDLTVHLLGHPEHADHVLRRRHGNYDRQTRSADAIRLVTGESLLTNDGEEWRRHRLLMQPAFNQVEPFAEGIERATEEMVDRWLARGGIVDVAAEMSHLTCTIVAKAFFGTDLQSDVIALERLLPPILAGAYARSTAIFPLHRFVRDKPFDDARTKLGRIVEEIVSRKPEGTLLARMADSLDDEELRNETVALLLAGHETTANALAWTFYLLATHRADADPVCAFLEAIRLYPPIWIVERRAIEEDEIGGYAIPEDSIVYVSPYILHRHEEFWPDAEAFRPERFAEDARPPGYLPFGAGPHHCIGAGFAMMEARTIIPAVLRRCRLELSAIARVEPQAWITLRPRHGVPLVVRRR